MADKSCLLFDTGAIYIPPLVDIIINNGYHTVTLDECVKNGYARLIWYDADAPKEDRRRMYDIKCYCKNILQGHDIITNKHDLHKIECLRNHLAVSWSLGESPRANLPWIIKPADGFSGEGVEIVTSENEFDEKLYHAKVKATKKSRTHKHGKIIICSYINDPLLYKGLKFHLRLFIMVGLFEGRFIHDVCPVGRVMTAAEPYIPGSSDKKVADSHLKSTKDNLTLDDITEANCDLLQDIIDKLIGDAKEYCKLVAKQCESHVHTYDECENGFHIMGADIMLTRDTFYLLEVNENPGFGEKFSHLIEWKKFNYDFFKWLDESFLHLIWK